MFELYALLVNICVMLATLAGLGITLYNFTRQQKLTFFERYTARYQHIMENMPEIFFQSKEQQEMARQEDVKKCDQYIRLYVDLCSEEYFLYTEHCIDDVVWKEWEEGILWAFTENEIVKKYWADKNNRSGYSRFSDYINNLIKEVELKETQINQL